MVVKQTILFIMPRLPFPPISGRKNSLYHYCRIIHELGYKLVVAAFLEMGDTIEKKPDFIDDLVILPNATGKEKMKHLVVDTFLKQKYPIQVSMFLSGKAKGIISELVQKYKPTAVIADMIRTTEYIMDISSSFRIADLDDTLSLRYERQLMHDIVGMNPYGQFINTFPKYVRRILLARLVKFLVIKTEVRLLKKYEKRVAKACNKVVFVAASEAEMMNKSIGEPDKAIAIPIGVDVDYFSAATVPLIHSPLDDKSIYVGFHGQMSVAHNENAVTYFIKEILPYITDENPKIKFLCIGAGVTDNLKALKNKNVIFTDFVSDVRAYLSACKAYVCPMRYGSGIKTKVLEALSMGLPVVATSIGAENIDVTNGTDIIIADEPRKFADEMLALLSNETKLRELSTHAAYFVRNNWTWENAAAKFEALFAEIPGKDGTTNENTVHYRSFNRA